MADGDDPVEHRVINNEMNQRRNAPDLLEAIEDLLAAMQDDIQEDMNGRQQRRANPMAAEPPGANAPEPHHELHNGANGPMDVSDDSDFEDDNALAELLMGAHDDDLDEDYDNIDQAPVLEVPAPVPAVPEDDDSSDEYYEVPIEVPPNVPPRIEQGMAELVAVPAQAPPPVGPARERHRRWQVGDVARAVIQRRATRRARPYWGPPRRHLNKGDGPAARGPGNGPQEPPGPSGGPSTSN